MSEEILEEIGNSSFVAGERQFNGEAIAPYTEGSRLLLLQVRGEEDSSIFFIWAFLYLHILLRKNKKEAISLCWNKSLFRERLFEWIATKSEIDRNTATELVSKIIEEATSTSIEVIRSPNQISNEGKV